MEGQEQESSNNGYKKSNVWAYEARIPPQLCDLIVEEFSKQPSSSGAVGVDNVVNPSVRNVETFKIPSSSWVNGIPMYFGFDANYDNFAYNITNVAFTEMFCYREGMFYKPHIDINPNTGHPAHRRKLTVIVQLSDESDYEGGELLVYNSDLNPVTLTKSKGSVLVFNSSLIHEVKPILSGTRYVLASWIIGPPFS